jgi:hypothetical protein
MNVEVRQSFVKDTFKLPIKMKYLLILQLLTTNFLFAQKNKDLIYFEGGILTQEIIKNNNIEEGQKVEIQNKVFGKNAKIIIDTIFKKYTIKYTDEFDETAGMTYTFDRYQYPEEPHNTPFSKLYIMKSTDQKGFTMTFYVQDYLSLNNELIINFPPLGNNRTLLFRVRGARRVVKLTN